MAEFKELFQSADWKQEKHVPVIEVPEKLKKGEFFDVKVAVGKEVAHPNKTDTTSAGSQFIFCPRKASSLITSGLPSSPPTANPQKVQIPAPFTPTTRPCSALRPINRAPSLPPATATSTESGRTRKTSRWNDNKLIGMTFLSFTDRHGMLLLMP
jgi:hypothetical protein